MDKNSGHRKKMPKVRNFVRGLEKMSMQMFSNHELSKFQTRTDGLTSQHPTPNT